MSKAKQAATSVIIMIVFSLGSKVLGFIREILIASKFGAGIETDTFFVAMAASGLFTTLIGAAINTTSIPVIAEVEAKEGRQAKIQHTNNMLNIVFALSILLTFLGWWGAPLLVKMLAKGFAGEQLELAVYLTRIGMPVLLFSLINPVLRSYLQSEMMFFETAASAFPYNLVYILFLLFFSGTFGIVGLVVANTVAVVSQVLLQIYGLRKTDFKYSLVFDIQDEYVTRALMLTIPVFIGTAINEINIIVDKTLASTLAEGSISALNYATRLNSLVLGVFITAITTVTYPMLAIEANNGDMEKLKKLMAYGINVVLLITIPAAIGLIVLSTPIVKVIFERGEFDAVATTMTAQALVFYALGLPSLGVRPLVSRVFFSLQDTKSPMYNGAVTVLVNVILNIVLVRTMGHRGLALATSLANILAVVLLLMNLRTKIGTLGFRSTLSCGIKSFVAAIVMGIVTYLSFQGLSNVFSSSWLSSAMALLLAISLGAVVYLVLCYAMGIEEVRLAVNALRAKAVGLKRRLIKSKSKSSK